MPKKKQKQTRTTLPDNVSYLIPRGKDGLPKDVEALRDVLLRTSKDEQELTQLFLGLKENGALSHEAISEATGYTVGTIRRKIRRVPGWVSTTEAAMWSQIATTRDLTVGQLFSYLLRVIAKNPKLLPELDRRHRLVRRVVSP